MDSMRNHPEKKHDTYWEPGGTTGQPNHDRDAMISSTSRCKRKEKASKDRLDPKSYIDTQNDGLENVFPFKHSYFGHLCWISGR